MDIQTAIAYFEQYLKSKNAQNDYPKCGNSNYTFFGNEFVEFMFSVRNDNAFIECESIELGNQIVFSFYVPEKYEDFEKILDILIVV